MIVNVKLPSDRNMRNECAFRPTSTGGGHALVDGEPTQHGYMHYLLLGMHQGL